MSGRGPGRLMVSLLGLPLVSPLVSLLACGEPAAGQVVAVRELGPTALDPGVRGRDGGYSAEVFGRSVWLFGDTILAAEDSRGSAWRNSSWAWTMDLLAEDGLADFTTPQDPWGGAAEFFPYTAEELAFNEAHAITNPDCQDPCGARRMLWPMAMVDDRAHGRVLAFYGKYGGEPGEWNFWSIGSSIAAWSAIDLAPARPVLDAGAVEPTLLFLAPEPQFGQAAVIVGELLYAFACTDRQIEHPCVLARVELGQVFDRQAWRFWNGEDWSRELLEAQTLFDGHTMLTVHRNDLLDRWLAIYSEPLGDGVYMRTATSLTGPWSTEALLFQAQPGADGAAPYAALAHPELSRDGGRFEYVSYYHGTGDWQGELRLVEVELAPP